MVKRNPGNYKTCNYCGKLKPVSDFITGTNVKLKITYSQSCKSCRAIIEKSTKKIKLPIKRSEKS